MLNVGAGLYIFDNDDSLMATEVKDEMLLSIIDSLKADSSVESGDKEYKDAKYGKSIAAYQYISEHDWVVVSRDSEDNIYSDANKSMRILGTICIFADIVIALLCVIFIRLNTRPLKAVEESIIQLQHLDLEKKHKLDSYINCKSEIGQIATAVDSLYDSFKEILLRRQEKYKIFVMIIKFLFLKFSLALTISFRFCRKMSIHSWRGLFKLPMNTILLLVKFALSFVIFISQLMYSSMQSAISRNRLRRFRICHRAQL